MSKDNSQVSSEGSEDNTLGDTLEDTQEDTPGDTQSTQGDEEAGETHSDYSFSHVRKFLADTKGEKGVNIEEFFPNLRLYSQSVRSLMKNKGDLAEDGRRWELQIPPPFDEKTSYETWKNEVEIWRLVTDLDIKKQALAVTLSLTGRAKASALEIAAGDLNSDTGMTALLTKLDSVYLKEEKDRQYEAYTEFDRITRGSGVSMVDHIIEFEHLYNKIRKLKMDLPDAMLAFKLLDTAGLDVKDKQLALTACPSVSFVNMKSALKRIFGDNITPPQEGGSAMQMSGDTSEATYYTRYTGKRESRSNWQQSQTVFPGTNPFDKHGRRTRCAVCQSKYHWAKDCPNKKEHVNLTKDEGLKHDIEECNITLFSNESLSETAIFMVEALGSAVIDTACTRTVCGEKWLDDHISELPQSKRLNMNNEYECTTFQIW
ncbi:bifunctional UDP-N-acetylglucosamine transferase and deubiquitinase ALG13 isoform X2 [Solea senegalensis]|uniref:Bifunctional UDP-N-acetylglucosamine transferase and deubiquitinase ALG13 isoform X2 n=1 Tax=Solea senegalensis TaxID=28829 RepID=A0AAV6QEL7_SOLSE|nr:bifunctional UDP-N-acetylglucosamine transferase and deubiquitinase ALG13 isoform X2 [Solea senegalensis]